MKRILALLIFITATLPVHAQLASIFYAPASAGSNNGTSCANAYALTDGTNGFNVAGKWGSGGTQIGAGTVVNLCAGTYTYAAGTTGALVFQGSGTSGHVITLEASGGAVVITAPYWSNGSAYGGPINTNAQSYLLINGTNITLQATANGTGLANQVDFGVGVLATGSSNVTVENLTIANIYVHQCTYPVSSCTDEGGQSTQGVLFVGANSNITITGNTIHDVKWGINGGSGTGSANTNETITGNTVYHIDHGIAIGMGGTGSTLAGLTITGNSIHDFQNWDDNGNQNHHDGIHTWAYTSGGAITSYVNSGNYIWGDFGFGLNAAIYAEANVASGNMPTPVFVNNLIVDQGSISRNGCGEICLSILNAPLIANNTVVGPGGFGTIGISLYYTTSGTKVENNVIEQMVEATNLANGATFTTWDYNNYSQIGANGWNLNSTFAAWQSACSCDSHGSNTNPNLNASFQPVAASTALLGQGSNLTSLSVTALDSDFLGNARPASGNWTMGAYNQLPVLATFTVSNTPGNRVPPFLPGLSEPDTNLYPYGQRRTNCGGTLQPKCTAPPAGMTNELWPQMLLNATNLYSHPIVERIEGDPMLARDWTCYDVPVGTAITGNTTAGITWSANGTGTTTFHVSSAAGIPTGSFYIDLFNDADGFPVPPTPQNTSAQNGVSGYTVLTSNTTGPDFNFTVTIPGMAAGSGTDIGYWVPTTSWYPDVPVCGGLGAGATLFPPTSAYLDTVIGMAQANPLWGFTVAVDAASTGTCNGNRIGPVVGVGTFSGLPPAAGQCHSTENMRLWDTALESGAPQYDRNGAGVNYGPSGTGQDKAREYGNEPDNYPFQSQTNAWSYRGSNFTVYSAGLTSVYIPPLSAGSGQTPGTYTGIVDTSAHTGTDAVITVVVNADGTCHPGAATLTNAGTNYYNNVTPTQPLFVVPSGGTPCTVLGQSESWMSDFLNASADMANFSLTPPVKFLNPSAAGNGYRAQFTGATGNTTCDPVSGCNSGVPVAPNELNMMQPAVGVGLGIAGQHNYPGAKANFCPNYTVSSVSRVGAASPGVSTESLVFSQPTNFQTNFNVATATYPSSPTASSLMTVTFGNLDSGITSYSCVNGIGGINSVCTFNYGGAPNGQVGQIIQANGTCFDSTTAGAPLRITSVGSTSITATWPGFADAHSNTCTTSPANGFDQLQVYSGAFVNLTGSSLSQADLTQATVAGVVANANPLTATLTVPSSYSTTYTSGFSATGGALLMTGHPAANITETPLGVNGTSLDAMPSMSCPNGSGNAYVYPPYQPTWYCGNHTSGYQSSNFSQLGNAAGITCTSPTVCTMQLQGAADSTTSGLVTIVSGTATNATNNVPKNPICNPPDIMLLPEFMQKIALLNGEMIEYKGLSIGTYPNGGGATPYNFTSPIDYDESETNFFSPAQQLINNGVQQGLSDVAWLLEATFNGANGTLSSTQNPVSLAYGPTGLSAATMPGGIAPPFSGMDRLQHFTGTANPYALVNYQFSPSTVGGFTVNLPQDVTNQTAPAIQTGYYNFLMFMWFLGAQGSPTQPTSWLPITPTGSGVVPQNFYAFAAKNSSLSDGHNHILMVNQSATASGDAIVDAVGETTATAYTLQFPDASTTQGQAISPSLVTTVGAGAVSGQNVTFSVPCVTQPTSTFSGINLMYNMRFWLTGYAAYGVPNQWVWVSTRTKPAWNCSPATASFTATVIGTPGSIPTNATGVAYEGCDSIETNPIFCTFGFNLAGQSYDGSYGGLPTGTLTGTALTAVSNVFTVPVPILSQVLLDASGATVPAQTPTFSPVAGSYGSAQNVTLSTTSSGAIMCYNFTGSPATNGAFACPAGSTLYSGPITVSSSATIYSVAGGAGIYSDSTVGSAAYTINGTASTPTFSPIAGTYSGAQTVTASTSTSGCGSHIYFDTSNPPLTNQTTFSVTVSETVYAYVHNCPGFTDSSVDSAAYTITVGGGVNAVSGGNSVSAGAFKTQ
jgi:hypothetical protein